MLAFLQYLIALMVAGAAEAVVPAAARPDLQGIGLAIAGFALAARVAGAVLARAGGDESSVLARVFFVAGAGRIGALFLFHFVCAGAAGVRLPAMVGVEGWWLVPRLLQLAPFFALIAALAWGLSPALEPFRPGARSGWRAVLGELRQAPLALAPVLIIVAIEDAIRVGGPASPATRLFDVLSRNPALQTLTWLLVLFGILLALPFALRLATRSRPLPPGPLRERLESYSRRTRFRYRQILVWPTAPDVINAAVIGALPRFRYVLLTRGLLETLDEDEVEAVFAHEAGHARRGHILLFFGFTSVFALMGLVPGANEALETVLSPLPPLFRGVALVVVWLGIVFGWISRRFEQEADVYGVETLASPESGADPAAHPFARAMSRIGEHVGAVREITGWRHFSIADRVAFVHRYLAEPEVRAKWRRSIRLLRGTLLLLIGGFALAAAVRVPGELRRAMRQWEDAGDPAGLALLQLNQALEARDPETRAGWFLQAGIMAGMARRHDESLRWLREAVALDAGNLPALVAYAGALETSARAAGARTVWSRVAGHPDAPAELRSFAASRSRER